MTEISGAGKASIVSQMTLVDWLDDLTVRFLLNLPPAELSSVARICFQIEEAQWFYEDFVRPLNPKLPSLNLRQFLLILFQHCPLLQGFDASQHVAAYEDFMNYKTRVPVRGAIMMDESMEKVVLVRGWKKQASWSFPRGKINKDEKDLACAIREVYEETGFDIGAAGLVEPNLQEDGQVKAIDVIMREQHMKLFVFRGISLDTQFEPRTRKEIGKIQWYNVRDLPGFKKQKGPTGHGQGDASSSKFYMVAPFLGPLKKWIGQQRRREASSTEAQHSGKLTVGVDGFETVATEDEAVTEQDMPFTLRPDTAQRPAEDLKRLLSIGQPPRAVQDAGQDVTVERSGPPSNGNDLLAILQGNRSATNASTILRTPLKHIGSALPAQAPDDSRPYFREQLSVGHQQSRPKVPHFPHSPERSSHDQYSGLQQAHFPGQRVFNPVPTTSAPSPQHPPANFPQHSQQELLLQQHSRLHFAPQSSMQAPHYANLTGNFPIHHHNVERQPSEQQSDTKLLQQLLTDGSSFVNRERLPTSPIRPLTNMAHQHELSTQLSNSQKPLGSGPSIPDPSNLPTPKLNAHSKKLLNAFTTIDADIDQFAPIPKAAANNLNGRAAGSQQQAALLDLFNQNASSAAPVEPRHTNSSASTKTSTVQIGVTRDSSPLNVQDRKYSLSEINRILPSKPKIRSPISTAPSAQQNLSMPQTTVVKSNPQQQDPHSLHSVHSEQIHRPVQPAISESKMGKQGHDEVNHQKTAQVATRNHGQEINVPSNVTVLQKPRGGRKARSPVELPQLAQSPKSTENGPPKPQISILQRPARQSPQSAEVRNTPEPKISPSAYQPQLLTRTSADRNEKERTFDSSDRTNANSSKSDHLLALFGKVPKSAESPTSSQRAIPTTPETQRFTEQADILAGSVHNGDPPALVINNEEHVPPPPRLQPGIKLPPQQIQQRVVTKDQPPHHILKPNYTVRVSTKVDSGGVSSPETPISPFVLGTPATAETRFRFGSSATLANNIASTPSSQYSPLSTTSTAGNKDLLLGYLNTVVEKEGHRSSKRQ